MAWYQLQVMEMRHRPSEVESSQYYVVEMGLLTYRRKVLPVLWMSFIHVS